MAWRTVLAKGSVRARPHLGPVLRCRMSRRAGCDYAPADACSGSRERGRGELEADPEPAVRSICCYKCRFASLP